MASRYQRSVQVQAISPSTQQAQNFESLADRLRSFADRKSAQLDQQAVIEGEQAGLAAATGKLGGQDLSDNSTIRSRAFNKGAMTAHAAAIQVDIRENIARIKQDNQFDSEGFNASVAGYREGLVEKMDASMRPHAEAELNDYASRAYTEVQSNVFKQETEAQLAIIGKAADGMQEDILIAARAGDVEQLTIKQEQLAEIYAEGVEAGMLSESAVQKAQASLEESIDGQLALGSLQRTLEEGGLEEAEAALKRFKKAKTPELQPSTKDSVIGKMETMLGRERAAIGREASKAKAEITAREEIIGDQVQEARYAFDNGFIPENIETLLDLSVGTKYESDLKDAMQFATHAAEFVTKPLLEQEAIINSLREKKNLGGKQAKLLNRLETVHNHTKTALSQDAISLAVEQGIISELPPLDPTDPESLKSRVLSAKIAQAHYGVPVSPLTDSEITYFGELLTSKDLSAVDKAGILRDLVKGLGGMSGPVFEKFNKKSFQQYMMVGELILDGATDEPLKILRGMEIITASKDILPSDIESQINMVIQDVYMENMEHHSAVVQATKALYAAMAVDNAEFSGTINISLLEKAIDGVTGGIMSIEQEGTGWLDDDNYLLAPPERGVTANMFENYLTGLSGDDIEYMGGLAMYEGKEAADAIREGRLVSSRKGSYIVISADSNEPLAAKDGEPFILEYGTKLGLQNKRPTRLGYHQ